jgi:hypothetical protein
MKVKVKIATALGLAATAAVVIGALAAVSGGAAAGQTLRVRELFTSVTTVDVGKKGPSQGDFQAWNDPLKDVKTSKIVGHVNGTCFLVDVAQQLYNCGSVDFAFSNGSVWAQGMISLKGAPEPPGQITTGTGAYLNARGSTTGKPAGANALDWTIALTS